MNWTDVLKAVGPSIMALTPAAPFAPVLVASMALAQQIHGAGNGPQKKDTALQIAAAIASAVNAVKNEPVVDPAQLSAVAGSAIDAVVGVVNLTHKAAA